MLSSWLAPHTATLTTSRKRSQADARGRGWGVLGLLPWSQVGPLRMDTFLEGSLRGLGMLGGSQKLSALSGIALSKKSRVRYVGKITAVVIQGD